MGTVSYLISSMLVFHKTLKNVCCSKLYMNVSRDTEEVSLQRVIPQLLCSTARIHEDKCVSNNPGISPPQGKQCNL
jgi:hypothetical protein